MNNLLRYLVLFILCSSLVTGCAKPPMPQQAAHACTTPAIPAGQPVTLNAPLDLVGPAVALAFTGAGPDLGVVYASQQEKPGQVVVWNTQTRQLTKRLEIAWIHPQLTSLSADGKRMVTVEDRPKQLELHRQEYEDNYGPELIELVEVWDVFTGKQQKVIPNFGTWGMGQGTRAISLSWDGDLILTVSKDDVDVDSVNPEVTQGGASIHPSFSPEESNFIPDTFRTGAFDQNGQSLVLGFESSEIWFEKITTAPSIEPAGGLAPQADGKKTITSLAFDQTGGWLAILRENSVEIRDLHQPPVLQWLLDALSLVKLPTGLPTADRGKLAFRPQNDVLALGAPYGWQLRRTSDLTLLAEQTNIAITSLAFSKDGCTVAFGTQEGIVEVWAVPTP